ncbi:hypothetical protein PR202_gb05026 [Eleusine coracana subsp. coracana]|uniref:Uncharacterized protein n=1 Tax=Eleusine coracana subsp. coracana TaxID=191504 RepID=A0AAV5E642_ELECO|nr:hypothetical protein PR202_gb05026 [Eleusine coracana subsp. coracana]
MEGEATNHFHTRVRGSTRGGGTAAERDLLLQWGNRKRLRCVSVHRRFVSAAATAAAERAAASQRRTAAAALQHRSLRSVLHGDSCSLLHTMVKMFEESTRNSEVAANMRSSTQEQQNDAVCMVISPDREHSVRGTNKNNGNLSTSPDDRKGSSSGSEASMWPNFAIALTNKEKEEDFLMFKGSRPPHRPKKRTKIIQKTINLVCPGTWLCDLTLERYEVREKKVSKKVMKEHAAVPCLHPKANNACTPHVTVESQYDAKLMRRLHYPESRHVTLESRVRSVQGLAVRGGNGPDLLMSTMMLQCVNPRRRSHPDPLLFVHIFTWKTKKGTSFVQ